MDTFTFNIPKTLKLDFNILALKQQRNMADIVRELIEKYVKDYNEKQIGE